MGYGLFLLIFDGDSNVVSYWNRVFLEPSYLDIRVINPNNPNEGYWGLLTYNFFCEPNIIPCNGVASYLFSIAYPTSYHSGLDYTWNYVR